MRRVRLKLLTQLKASFFQINLYYATSNITLNKAQNCVFVKSTIRTRTDNLQQRANFQPLSLKSYRAEYGLKGLNGLNECKLFLH